MKPFMGLHMARPLLNGISYFIRRVSYISQLSMREELASVDFRPQELHGPPMALRERPRYPAAQYVLVTMRRRSSEPCVRTNFPYPSRSHVI
jgi:hypothetical protein